MQLTDEQILAIAVEAEPPFPWGIGSTRLTFLRAVHAVLAAHSAGAHGASLIAPFVRPPYEAIVAIPIEENWSVAQERFVYARRVADMAVRSCEVQLMQRLAAHPQPMTQTDAARDAEDAKRYRFIKSQMKVGAVQTQLPLYRTLHWIGYEGCSDVHNADAVIDAEIERIDREKGE